jgi:O-antigen/teichoic acid export membrane protein
MSTAASVAATQGSGSATRGAGWLGVGAVVVKAAQTLVLLLLAAMLAPAAIGVIAIGAMVLNVTAAVTDLGTSAALVHWRGDAERAARSALTLGLGIAAVITATTWAAAPALSALLNAGDLGVTVIRGMILCLPFYAAANVSQELLRRALDFRRRVLPDIIGALCGTALTIGLAAAGHGAMSLVYGQLVQAALILLLCWRMRPPVVPGWRRDDIAGLVSYGGHLAGAGLLTLLMLNVDYLIVANQLGTTAVGVYSMAFRLAYMPYLLLGMVIGGAAFAHLCRLRGTDIGRAVIDTVVVLHALVVPLYVGIILLAPQLALLGEQWTPGVPALRWLAVYGLALSALEPMVVALRAVARTRDTLLLTALHLALLSALLMLWVDRGVTMVAVAQLVAAVFTLVAAVLVVSRRVSGLDWRCLVRRLGPVAAGAASMTAVTIALQSLLPWSRVSVGGLTLVGSCAAAAYVVPVVLLDRGGHTGVARMLRVRS